MTNLKRYTFNILFFALLTIKAGGQQSKPVVWKFNNLNKVGDNTTEILGKPLVANDGGFTATWFNGADASLIMPYIPVAGWQKFTIEVLFKPDGDGPLASRFMHFEDKDGVRGTLEVRMSKNKTWYLDAFLKNGAKSKGLALADSTRQKPTDRWYWVAMVYDGKKMTSYINGVQQLEGEIDFPLVSIGKIAFGARLNKVSWFKGSVSEARFYPEVLTATQLAKVKE